MRHFSSTVSVIIPVKNRPRLLCETLTSIVSQTYNDWEVIIIDDRSEENIVKLVHHHFGTDPRILVLTRQAEKAGAQVCRNEGVETAKGAYLIFLDSDDLLASFCFEQRVEVMERNPSLDFAVFPMLQFHRVPGDSKILWNTNDSKEPDEERFLKQDMPWSVTGPIWRRTALQHLGRWDEALTSFQDWEYHLRACVIGLRYMKFDEPDCFYRVPNGTDSIGARYFEHENILSRITAFKKISALFIEKGKLSRHIQLLLVGLFIRNMIQLLERSMKTEAEMMLQAAYESKVLRSHDRLLAKNILKEGAIWRYRKLIQWWSRVQWPKSIRYDYWDPVSFCSCEADPKCRALEERLVTQQLTEHREEVNA